ncbi:dTDP-4-dehydrorhamnose reductase [Pannonibacter tanglangensis]|uniref:dTDP-4-dehydrorhamnose reductase n=1 Tax=Pannonibacter tanglangensis TaxID=2750084 RepID=A0ABW9ZC51_9HYPH|nr:dTDP-4-dehydrorhamnose reductase [Pannonibacter sp. XCT-34]NBN62390.1 dTDP-4-dehydrorhamnose reductase [Pannonibacter sp. XCT-34]
MRIAVTGTSGQVVTALVERGTGAGATIVPVGRPQLDLLDPSTVLPALAATKPDVIVSAAAYTAVDKAEAEQDVAWRINATGAGTVAAAARVLGVPVIHLSTDYVFDGSKDGLWTEDDPVGPLGVYGASKLAGEVAVASATPNHAILRIAWVVSPFGANFVKTMLRLAETRDHVRVVADQYGGPTSALDIADGILAVAKRLLSDTNDSNLRGTFHMGPTNTGSWADLADVIFAALAETTRKLVSVERISTAEYPTPARRPPNSRLDTRKIERAHGIVLPEWQTSIEMITRRLIVPA